MKTVYLVSCVTRKRERAAAKDLYISEWFLRARRYVEYIKAPGDSWYILSAKHHLLHPETELSCYNETLNTMPIKKRREWSQTVFDALRKILMPGDTVVILAGSKYREFLKGDLESLGVTVKVPMEGMRIGEQLRWLKEQIGDE